MGRKRKLFLAKLLIIFAVSFAFLAHHYFYDKYCLEVRYGFDFGSGAIKSKAAIYDTCQGKIHKIFGQFEKPVKFIECLKAADEGQLVIGEQCIVRALIEFHNFEREYNISCNKDKCAGVATAWARKAQNVDEIFKDLAAVGITLKVLSQEEEGEFGFKTVIQSEKAEKYDPNKIVVWDIGGGSFQLSTYDDEGKIHVYRGPQGVESFERELRRVFDLPKTAPNPFFSGDMLTKAFEYAYKNYGEAVLSDPVIARKLRDPEVKVFAIGGPMTRGLKDEMDVPEFATQLDLEATALLFSNRSVEDVFWNSFPKLPSHYVPSAQVSVILIHGIMRGAGIKEMQIIDAALGDYVLNDVALWKKQAEDSEANKH